MIYSDFKILIIDDNPLNIQLLEGILGLKGYSVLSSNDGKNGIDLALKNNPDLILLDITMPKMSGYEVCKTLRMAEETVNTPIIFLSAMDQLADKLEGFKVGGNDYITKPFQALEVLARIETHVKIHYLAKNLEEKNNELKHEIDRRKVIERKLVEQATRDPLTKTYNRRHFFYHAEKEINRSSRTGELLSLIMFDLDKFKNINDEYGHLIGDEALVKVSEVAKKSIRKYDILARYGGEEFLVLLPTTKLETAELIAERIRKSISEIEIYAGSVKIPVTASIGVAEWQRSLNVEELIEHSDNALYEAKESGRNRLCTYRG